MERESWGTEELEQWDFPDGPVVKPATNAGALGSIPKWGTKIPHAAVWWEKKALEQDSGDLGTFFTRDKQALGLRMAVGMIGWIYKHKAEGVVWELADDSW